MSESESRITGRPRPQPVPSLVAARSSNAVTLPGPPAPLFDRSTFTARAPVVQETVAPPAEGQLPPWLPKDFDLDRQAALTAKALRTQGVTWPPPSPQQSVKRVVLCDADLTLLDTHLPIYLMHKVTGEHLRHPETGRLVQFGVSGVNPFTELSDFRKKYPQVPMSEYSIDFYEYGSIQALLASKEIDITTKALRAEDADPTSSVYMITARSGDSVSTGLHEYLAERDVDIDGAFAVNSPRHLEALALPKVESDQRKAITNAGILHMHALEAGRPVESCEFFDDDEGGNLESSFQLLPVLFPATRFEFTDVVKDAEGGFRFLRYRVVEPRITAAEDTSSLYG